MSHFVIVENKEQYKKYAASYAVPKGKYNIHIDTSKVQLRNETVERLTFEFVNCFTNISKTYATIPTKLSFTATKDLTIILKLNHFRATYILKKTSLPLVSFIESSYNQNLKFYQSQIPENTTYQINFDSTPTTSTTSTTSTNANQTLFQNTLLPLITVRKNEEVKKNTTNAAIPGIGGSMYINTTANQSNIVQKYRVKMEEEKQSFFEDVPLVASKLKKRIEMILENLLYIKELIQLKHIENKDENAIMVNSYQEILMHNFTSLLEITKSNDSCFSTDVVDATATNLGITNGELYPKIPLELYIDILGNSNYHTLLHYLCNVEFIRLTPQAREKIDHLIQTCWKYFDFLNSKLVGFDIVWQEYFGLFTAKKEKACET